MIDELPLKDSGVNYLDIGIVLVILLNVVLGLFRGMVWQVTRLLGLVLGLFLGGRLAKPLGKVIEDKVHSFPHPTQEIIAFVAVFLLVWILFAIVTHYSRGLIEKLRLKAYDRSLGGILGVAKGFMYVFVILLVLQSMFVPEPKQSAGDFSITAAVPKKKDDGTFYEHLQVGVREQFRESALVPRIDTVASVVKGLFPESWVEKWDDLVELIQKTTDRIKSPELLKEVEGIEKIGT